MSIKWPRPDAAELASIHTRRLKELARQKQLLEVLWKKLDTMKLAAGNASDRVLLSDLKIFVDQAEHLQREVEAIPLQSLADHMPTLSRYVNRCAARPDRRAFWVRPHDSRSSACRPFKTATWKKCSSTPRSTSGPIFWRSSTRSMAATKPENRGRRARLHGFASGRPRGLEGSAPKCGAR